MSEGTSKKKQDIYVTQTHASTKNSTITQNALGQIACAYLYSSNMEIFGGLKFYFLLTEQPYL